MTGFYLPTINDEGEPEVAHAPNFVYAPTYTLRAEQHANKTDLPGRLDKDHLNIEEASISDRRLIG